MKILLQITIVSSVLLLASCASTQKTAHGNAPAYSEQMVVDGAYVAYVEGMAKKRGTTVLWIDPPKKKIVQAASR